MNNIARKLHRDRDEILGFCNRHKRIHLFGAGLVGSLMQRYLMEEGVEICNVLVSPGHKQADFFQKIPIREMKAEEWLDDDGIIVAVGQKFQEQILEMLLHDFKLKKDNIYVQQIYPATFQETIEDALLQIRIEEKSNFFKNYKELDALGKKWNTDKSSTGHNYLNKYEFFFKELKDKQISILELGVCNGSSLQMWKDYFVNAIIYGVDIEEKCRKFEGERCNIVIQDLGNEELLDELSIIKPSVIIDDASHFTSHQIEALYHLFPILEPGGVYIVEDLGTNFRRYRNQGYNDTIISCYEFCQAVAKTIASGEFLAVENMNPACILLKEEIEFLAKQMEMICFIHESCIMIKK